jgi:signal transduction histidine kinase
MRERVIAIGGRLPLATSPGSTGVNVRAELTPVALS